MDLGMKVNVQHLLEIVLQIWKIMTLLSNILISDFQTLNEKKKAEDWNEKKHLF